MNNSTTFNAAPYNRHTGELLTMSESDVEKQIVDLFGPLSGAGKFINYGYWRQVDLSKKLSREDFENSQKELYRLALQALRITPSDNLLEIGCGRGYGTALALEEFKPAEAHGIDLVPMQIARSRAFNLDVAAKHQGRLIYRPGSATQIPYEENKFDKLITIEVIPHFSSLNLFADEVKRVARRPARLAVASFFAPHADFSAEQWDEIFPWPQGIHYGYSIPELENMLEEEGFANVEIISIGEHVFPALHTWFCQNGGKDTVRENVIIAYECELIDYYLISADLQA